MVALRSLSPAQSPWNKIRRHRRHIAQQIACLFGVETDRDPKAALQLLAGFMESIEQISKHCRDDDFGSSQLSDRAWRMVEKLAATLPVEDGGPAIERLRGEFAARTAG